MTDYRPIQGKTGQGAFDATADDVGVPIYAGDFLVFNRDEQLQIDNAGRRPGGLPAGRSALTAILVRSDDLDKVCDQATGLPLTNQSNPDGTVKTLWDMAVDLVRGGTAFVLTPSDFHQLALNTDYIGFLLCVGWPPPAQDAPAPLDLHVAALGKSKGDLLELMKSDPDSALELVMQALGKRGAK